MLLTISVSMNTFGNMERKYEGTFRYFWYVFKRMARLLPNYIITILFVTGIVGRCQNPNTIQTTGLVHSCQDDLWQNLLFINNFFQKSLDHMKCLPQTWYIAANFQLWIFTPIVWHAFFVYPKITITILACSGFIQMTAAVALSIAVNDFNFFEYFAYQPYFQLPAWGFGLIAGFLLCNQKVPGLGKKSQCALWSAELLFIVIPFWSILFGVISADILVDILVIISPVFVALCIAYLGSGYGGVLNDFLSHPFWVLASHSSYSTLLWHWVFINWVGARATEFMSANILHAFMFSVGCYFCSIALSIWIEAPFREMMKIKRPYI